MQLIPRSRATCSRLLRLVTYPALFPISVLCLAITYYQLPLDATHGYSTIKLWLQPSLSARSGSGVCSFMNEHFYQDFPLFVRADGTYALSPPPPNSSAMMLLSPDGMVGLHVGTLRHGWWAITSQERTFRLIDAVRFKKEGIHYSTSSSNFRGEYDSESLPSSVLPPILSFQMALASVDHPWDHEFAAALDDFRSHRNPPARSFHAVRGRWINAGSLLCLFLAITSARNFFTLPFRFISARRAAKLGKCPTCGYDLTGLPAPVCPECGRAHPPHATPTATPSQPDLIPTSRPSDPT